MSGPNVELPPPVYSEANINPVANPVTHPPTYDDVRKFDNERHENVQQGTILSTIEPTYCPQRPVIIYAATPVRPVRTCNPRTSCEDERQFRRVVQRRRVIILIFVLFFIMSMSLIFML